MPPDTLHAVRDQGGADSKKGVVTRNCVDYLKHYDGDLGRKEMPSFPLLLRSLLPR